MAKNVIVTKEKSSGRNLEFKDVKTKEEMTRAEFVKKIEKNVSNYAEDYYVRKQNGLKTPISKPDGKTKNNLG